MKIRAILSLVVIVGVGALLFLWGSRPAAPSIPARNIAQSPAPVSLGAPKFTAPSGDQIFKVVQAAGIYPRFSQVEINPPDVHVGDKQTLRAVVEDLNPIVSVTAETQLDHEKIAIPLKLVGATSAESVLPTKYAVGSGGKLVILENAVKPAAFGASGVANASQGGAAVTYEASWIVRDTHNTTYRTIFTAKNSLGQTSLVTLAWSDACGIPNGGDWTMSTSCTISSTDGVDNGSATLSAGTLTLNAAFAFNSGKSVTISSGSSIALGAGGQLIKTNLWAIDADLDGYAPNATQFAQDSAPVNGRQRRFIIDFNDCYDANANAYPGQTSYFTTNRGDGSFDYDCNGVEAQQYSSLATCLIGGGGSNPPACSIGLGFQNSVPACGVTDIAGAKSPGLIYACSYNGTQCVGSLNPFSAQPCK